MKKPEIGTVMYFVQEHLYYQKEKRTAPFTEYCVCSGTVKGFFTKGYTDVRIVGRNSNGHPTPYTFPLSEIGKRLFYTFDEAAALAEEKTDQYEKTWGWMEDEPLRRPWRDKQETYKGDQEK